MLQTFDFTSASTRALGAAWGCRADESGPIESQHLLWGILSEPECRGAILLGERGITARELAERFFDLRYGNAGEYHSQHQLSESLRRALRTVVDRYEEKVFQVSLATEHLLLAVSLARDDGAQWLRSLGVRSEEIEEAIDAYQLKDAEPPNYAAMELDDISSQITIVETPPRPEDLASLDGSPPAAASLSAPVSAIRVLDAAANRATEGLRVVEDYVRFVLDDRHLTGQLKSLRHDLTSALAILPRHDRQAARETQADVGTSIKTPTELTRADLRQVVAANFARATQALRSLEEFAKTIDSQLAARLEPLRYRLYTLERAIELTSSSRAQLADAKLYVLVDGRASLADFTSFVSSLVAAGVHVIQLRDKARSDRELIGRSRELVRLTAGSKTRSIINDRPDIALLSGADGVHVGQDELTVKDARQILGPSKLIGVSTHSIEQARAAVLEGADYLGVGPVFPSETKSFGEFPGLSFVREVAAEISLPAFAIGGINPFNISQVVFAGASRVAVSSAIASASDPAGAAKEMLGKL